MDYFLTIAKTFTEGALGILKLRADDRTRQRLADLLGQASDCVLAISTAIHQGTHAADRCGELAGYIAHIHALVEKETDERTADHLTFWLEHVEAVPGVARVELGKMIENNARPLWSKAARNEQSQSIAEIAGLIRAVGNLLRV